MTQEELIQRQLDWYTARNSGCAFAAYIARNADQLGWSHAVLDAVDDRISRVIRGAVEDPGCQIISILFPNVTTGEQLVELTEQLRSTRDIWLEQDETFNGERCLGFRARVGSLTSWISGFGPMEFLPETRQAPCVELAIRPKPRPNYTIVMKEAPPSIVHLADVNLYGMAKGAAFRSMWNASFRHTERRLGHRPDLRSAAKTTFAIPESFFMKRD